MYTLPPTVPRKRLTFTIEEETYRAIVERLEADELVDDWVRDAIDERLNPYTLNDQDFDDREPLEFVDDCSI